MPRSVYRRDLSLGEGWTSLLWLDRSIGKTCLQGVGIGVPSVSPGCCRWTGRGWRTSSCPDWYISDTCFCSLAVDRVFLQASVDGRRPHEPDVVATKVSLTTNLSPTSTCLQVGSGRLTYLQRVCRSPGLTKRQTVSAFADVYKLKSSTATAELQLRSLSKG